MRPAKASTNAQQLNQAEDLRDKTCRDARQTIAVACNDTHKLNDPLMLKPRNACRQRFRINPLTVHRRHATGSRHRRLGAPRALTAPKTCELRRLMPSL